MNGFFNMLTKTWYVNSYKSYSVLIMPILFKVYLQKNNIYVITIKTEGKGSMEEKVVKNKNGSFMKNVIMLMMAQIVIKILGFIYKLIIINIDGFGDVGNGYYNVGYQIYAVLLTLSSAGIPSAIAKLVSERVAIGDHKGAYRLFKIALKIFTVIGAILSIMLFMGANFISEHILNVPDVKYVLMVLAPAILFVTISSVFRGYFAGLNNMKATSVSQTLEQFFNCTLTIMFVYAVVGKDPAIMAAAGNLSTTLSILISFIYLLIYFKRRKKELKLECKNQEIESENKTTKQLIKRIMKISIPMTIGALISVITSTIDSVTISNCIQKAYEGILIGGKEVLEAKAMELAGVLSKVETIIHLPLAVNIAFYTALVPAISSALSQKDVKTATKRLSFSFALSFIITIPCAVGLSFLANPILKVLYPSAPDGAILLIISTFNMILIALNYIINGGLYGVGKVNVPVIALTCGIIVKVILNVILVSNPKINIYGAAISSIICQVISFVISYVALKREIKLELNVKNYIIKPLVSAITMGIFAIGAYKILNINFGNTISTVLAISVGAIVYGMMIIITRTFSKEDIHILPYGKKIYKILTKMKLYKEEEI